MGDSASSGGGTGSTVLLAIGDPVLDLCTSVPESFVSSLQYTLGGCDQIDDQSLDALLARLEADERAIRRVPGGSAANVAKCFARLANTGSVYFAGTLGNDICGREYRRAMEAVGVKMSHVTVHATDPNGVCLCMVTESGERTMRTALRASRTHELSKGTIDAVRADWAHFEGYYVYKPSIVQTMERLKGAGAKISFDFASFDVIESRRDLFEQLLEARLIDVLFCNEDEAVAFGLRDGQRGACKEKPDARMFAREMAESYGLTVVVSRGAKGCVAAAWAADRGCVEEAEAPAAEVAVVDTIGAGDHFSAGFLWAISHGASLGVACACGCLTGAAAVQVSGADIGADVMQQVAREVQALLEGRGDG